MKDFRREFSSSNDFCERRKIDDESRRESQIDVFVVIILFLKIVFSLNYFSTSLVLVFVFVATIFSLRTSMWRKERSEFISTCVFMICVSLTCVFLICVILICVFSTCVSSMSCAKRLEIIIENSRVREENENES
jgi:predicted membrane protein